MHGCAEPMTCPPMMTAIDKLPVDPVYTPYQLGKRSGCSVLAVGGELKSAICLYSQREAKLSQSQGSLTDPQCYRQFVYTIEHLRQRFDFSPEVVAHDLHPLYLSSRYAVATGLPTVAVQHHHAHLLSVMADWDVSKPVVGICADGVGYGSDGAAWGCEVMRCAGASFDRLGHMEYFPLAGADAVAVETWRSAAALLWQAFGSDWTRHTVDAFGCVKPKDVDRLDRMIMGGLNTPMTSSLGRVFDGISFLLGLCERNDREAQAAIALEQAASATAVEPYPYETTAGNGAFRMSLAPAIRAIVKDRHDNQDVGRISARFHETVARMLATTAIMACERCGLHVVALSGGCFANQRLLTRVTERLEQRHLNVLYPRRVPCGDAGLALGQAVAASAIHREADACV